MAIVFAVRGNSFDARYSSGGKTSFKFNPSQVTTASGGLSGTVYDLSSTQSKFVSWTGYKNTPNGRAISVLMRFAPLYTGSPAANRSKWAITTGANSASLVMPFMECRHLTTGNLTMLGKNESGATTMNSGAAWSPTSGTYYDVVFTWDGTTTANAVKIYVDGTLLSQATASAAMASGWTNTDWRDITIGATPNVTVGIFNFDELVIWDTVIDPTSVALVSGTGSLNGASRTSLVDVASFDGQVNTNPGISHVRNGTGYTISGTSFTGTAYIPAASDVRLGTNVDATTGTLDLPATNVVLSGIVFDNTTKTGTLVSPTANEIADTIWDEATSGHTTSGSFGALIQKLLTVAKFLGLK
jgi:hypothetical protein